MKQIAILTSFLFLFSSFVKGQVGIGTTTPHSSAKLEISSTSQGILFPRMTSTQRIAIQAPTIGLMVYQTNGTPGVYHFDGTNWRNLSTGYIPDNAGFAVTSTAIVSTVYNSVSNPNGVHDMTSIAIDRDGIMYVTNGHRISKIYPEGASEVIAGSVQGFADGPGSTALFNNPRGIALDTSGNIYVADGGNNRIRKITPGGNVTTLAGDGTAGFLNAPVAAARFNGPSGVVLNEAGEVFVSDRNNNVVRKIASGLVSTYNTNATTPSPTSIAMDLNGSLYVTSATYHMIYKISGGTVTELAGNPTSGTNDGSGFNAQFSTPYSIAADLHGNLYVTDLGSSMRVRKVRQDGAVMNYAGKLGQVGNIDGNLSASRFYLITGICTDYSKSTIFVLDNSGTIIRKISL